MPDRLIVVDRPTGNTVVVRNPATRILWAQPKRAPAGRTPTFSAWDLGLAFDGTDESARFAAALDAVPAGGTLELPAGVTLRIPTFTAYQRHSPLRILGHKTRLVGAGQRNLVANFDIVADTGWIEFEHIDFVDLDRVTSFQLLSGTVDQVAYRRCTFTGCAAPAFLARATTGPLEDGAYSAGIENLTIEECEVEDCTRGFQFALDYYNGPEVVGLTGKNFGKCLILIGSETADTIEQRDLIQRQQRNAHVERVRWEDAHSDDTVVGGALDCNIVKIIGTSPHIENVKGRRLSTTNHRDGEMIYTKGTDADIHDIDGEDACDSENGGAIIVKGTMYLDERGYNIDAGHYNPLGFPGRVHDFSLRFTEWSDGRLTTGVFMQNQRLSVSDGLVDGATQWGLAETGDGDKIVGDNTIEGVEVRNHHGAVAFALQGGGNRLRVRKCAVIDMDGSATAGGTQLYAFRLALDKDVPQSDVELDRLTVDGMNRTRTCKGLRVTFGSRHTVRTWRGAYNAGTAYVVGDVVETGAGAQSDTNLKPSWIALAPVTGVTPGTDATKWGTLSSIRRLRIVGSDFANMDQAISFNGLDGQVFKAWHVGIRNNDLLNDDGTVPDIEGLWDGSGLPLAFRLAIRDNKGYRTEAHGQATIANGSATVVVQPKLARAPTAITVTPEGNETVWVPAAGRGSNAFTLTRAGTVGALVVDWWASCVEAGQ